MKFLIIFISILLFCILWKNYIEYENYKNEPYITVIAMCGLNNKLRVLLSYLYKANKENKKLKIIWHICSECPERFDNLFEPINNVEIIYVENILKLDDYDYNKWDEENKIYIKENYYSLLKPLPEIQEDINNTIEKLGNNYIACHIRRTDALTHHTYKKYIKQDDEYIDFINQYPIEYNIYIATDCRKTQQKFFDLYGDRLVYKKIENNTNLRQTSLLDAVKDMYVCADATYFMRSHGSFSNTIEHLRNLKN